jgi:hypothetical protein
MSEETVRQWHRMFKDGQRDLPSVVSDELLQSVDQKICEKQRFIISQVSCEFLQISCTVLYEIIIVRLGNHKFCARWVPKMLIAVSLTFL